MAAEFIAKLLEHREAIRTLRLHDPMGARGGVHEVLVLLDEGRAEFFRLK